MIDLLLGLVAAIALADFLSGFWHWIEDRYFDERWPIIGEYIAKPNSLHHAHPTAFLNQSYWSRNWTTILPAAGALAITAACRSPWWVLLSIAMVSQANELHAWAHRRVKSRWIRGLQELGLLQSVPHHMAHHRDPFSRHYCVMTDWLNPVLDRTRFWFAAEWCLERVGIPIRQDCKEMDARSKLLKD